MAKLSWSVKLSFKRSIPWPIVARRNRYMDVDIPDITQGQEDNHVERMLLPVTATIYNNGIIKTCNTLAFEMGIGAVSDKDLHRFIERTRRGFGTVNRCAELKIKKFGKEV